MVLVIDNYDSFVYNLVQYLGELGAEPSTVRNDAITVEAIALLNPTHIVLSPGPCTPNEAGITLEVIRRYGGSVPILGVCLGHQAIGQVYGGKVVRAEQLLHGKTCRVRHTDDTLHSGLPNPFTAVRYHSLLVEPETMPSNLRVTAWSDDGEIMALQHEALPVYGVQYHPESYLTEGGHTLLRNFLAVPG